MATLGNRSRLSIFGDKRRQRRQFKPGNHLLAMHAPDSLVNRGSVQIAKAFGMLPLVLTVREFLRQFSAVFGCNAPDG